MEAATKRVVGRPFQPGQSGNPSGRRPALLTNALLKRLTPEKADELAAILLEKAEAGEAWALEKVWDRVEGKVPNRNENGNPGDFDADLSDVDTQTLKRALKRVK